MSLFPKRRSESYVQFVRLARSSVSLRVIPQGVARLDPLDQSALLDTQRSLYNLALFNEVNTAIQNPNGDESYKNILLNITEAKRWDISYGFGFEVQTGAPAEGCLSAAEQALLGITNSYKCNPNGHTGASPRILFNVSRTNLRGTDQSITLQRTTERWSRSSCSATRIRIFAISHRST